MHQGVAERVLQVLLGPLRSGAAGRPDLLAGVLALVHDRLDDVEVGLARPRRVEAGAREGRVDALRDLARVLLAAGRAVRRRALQEVHVDEEQVPAEHGRIEAHVLEHRQHVELDARVLLGDLRARELVLRGIMFHQHGAHSRVQKVFIDKV